MDTSFRTRHVPYSRAGNHPLLVAICPVSLNSSLTRNRGTLKDSNDLFRKLLADRDSLDGIARYNDGIILRRTKEKRTQSAKLTFRLLEAVEKKEYEIENIVAELDPVAAFKAVTSEIVDLATSGSIVVVIDESPIELAQQILRKP